MFHTIFYTPLYNALVFLGYIIPGNDIGVAIIVLTVIVKLALFPLAHKSLTTQSKIKKIEPEIKRIQKEHKKNPEEQGRQMMALYKQHGINPFSSFILLIIQIPILIALYMVFRNGLVIDKSVVYSFIPIPSVINPLFFGLVDLSKSNYILGIIAGATQFVQARFALPPSPPKEAGEVTSIKDDFARSMNMQARYFLPIVAMLVSFKLASAVVLYWVTSNLFAISHELFVRRRAELAVTRD
jgi:YidC/Oxa1 family membrane protein insertase